MEWQQVVLRDKIELKNNNKQRINFKKSSETRTKKRFCEKEISELKT